MATLPPPSASPSTLWAYLDRAAERRASQPRSPFATPQLLIALILIGLFAWAFESATDKDTKNLMVGALIAAFAGAWGYFLGSSNGAGRANDRADHNAALNQDLVKLLPAPAQQIEPAADTTLTLKPGERAEVAAERTPDRDG